MFLQLSRLHPDYQGDSASHYSPVLVNSDHITWVANSTNAFNKGGSVVCVGGPETPHILQVKEDLKYISSRLGIRWCAPTKRPGRGKKSGDE